MLIRHNNRLFDNGSEVNISPNFKEVSDLYIVFVPNEIIIIDSENNISLHKEISECDIEFYTDLYTSRISESQNITLDELLNSGFRYMNNIE